MGESLVLKKNPKIEFQFLVDGFKLIDRQSEQNSGFYSYHDLQSVVLNKVWFPRFAKYLRIITWILNGVPYFPNANEYKKASLMIYLNKQKIGIWLTDTSMADQAKKLKSLLGEKNKAKHGE